MALIIPVEICDMVVNHIATVETDYSLRDVFPYAVEDISRPRLLSLRLVSRNFCAAASRDLFKHIVAPIECSLDGRNHLLRLVEISRSEYAAHVRHLETGFGRWRHSHGRLLDQDIQDLAGLLLPCLAQLPNLRVLKFRASSESLTRDQEGSAIRAIITALRYVPLPRLEGLELSFPIAYDFGSFFPDHYTALQIPIENILRSLKHLSLQVTAFTGAQGQRWGTLVSPALVELAPGLSTLRITSTDILPFYTIHFSPALGMTSLCLERVLITFNHFSALIDQGKDYLEHIELSSVHLHSGSWGAVLAHLRQLPHLIDVSIESCGYRATGPNAYLVGILAELDDPKPLETMDPEDYEGLYGLREFVNKNRVALGLHPFERTDPRWS